MNYVKRNNHGITVSERNSLKRFNKGIFKYIDELCMMHFSTLEGRRDAVRYRFNIQQKIPLLINRNVTLFVTESPRNYEAVFINYHEVLSFESLDEKCNIIFKDGTKLLVEKTVEMIINEIKKVEKILEVFYEM